MSPVDYHAWTHRPKAQGGTDPIEFGSTSAILTGWEAETDGLVDPDIWTSVASSGFAFFNDGYDPPEMYALDLDAGTITWTVDTLCIAVGHANFIDDFNAGDVVAVAIKQIGSSERIINQLTAGAAGELGTNHLSVCAPVWNPITPASIELQVFHNSATSMTLNSATLVVSRMVDLIDAHWITHA